MEKMFEESYSRGMHGDGMGPLTAEKMKNNDGTAVTVICITYGHEKFIAQALDSFVMQKTNFKFKIFVGEDCGPDRTADIVREYAARYPELIVPFIREKNMGAQHNLIDLCQRADSPYLAFCEGDDYWIDEYKLQKQFDYMEEHKNIPICVTKTRVDAPQDWHLRNWYRENKNHEIILPDGIPGIKEKASGLYTSVERLNNNIGHTSTFFFRWNYDLKIPDWYYEGDAGDIPLLLMQLGANQIYLLPAVTSVYRINSGSVFFWKGENQQEFFLKTRISCYIHWMIHFWEFAKMNFPQYPLVPLENLIKQESANYLNACVALNRTDLIAEFFAKYPEAGRISLNAYLSFYRDSRQMTNSWTWEGYKLIARNRYYRNLLRPYAAGVKKWEKLKTPGKLKIKHLISFICYWLFTIIPKKNNIWVFSGFAKKGYMDNSKYLYEWIAAHHPEIHAYWLTLDDSVYQKLKKEGKPVLKFRTKDCCRILSRAGVAFTDHFIMSDYENISGFNDRIKVVQLWHGVGLKAIGNLKNTDIPGVMFSDDMLVQSGDNFGIRLLKRLRYFRHAYFREKFERYFLLVCPGEERVLQIADPWHIPREHCMFSGHPRNIFLHQLQECRDTSPVKILYAPTYRWNANTEKSIIHTLIEAFPLIEKCMEDINGQFMIRLHPHTWRNYSSRIQAAMADYPRISYDREKDVYTTLGTYSVMISDYSSIAYDFVLLNRPIVFYCPDLQDFMKQEDDLNYDYMEYSPGPKTATWEETMERVREYVHRPEKDSAWRCRIRDEFYRMDVNDANNSERIVQEVKSRLGMKEKNV